MENTFLARLICSDSPGRLGISGGVAAWFFVMRCSAAVSCKNASPVAVR